MVDGVGPFTAPGPKIAATSGLPPRGDLTGRRHFGGSVQVFQHAGDPHFGDGVAQLDGDGWVHCAAGHRHWGRHGAAGLLLSDGRRAVLQHRAPWTHEGDTWGLPGGARDSHESAVRAALREAREEAALDSTCIEPIGLWVVDHGGWSYTTVVARPLTELAPHAANAESSEVRWWDLDSISGLALHTGFASSWPALQRPVPRLVLLAPPSLLTLAAPLRELGVPTASLPFAAVDTALPTLIPRLADRDSDVAADDLVVSVGDDVPFGWLVEVTNSQVAAAAL